MYAAPFAVDLNADGKTFVEPDLCVICDQSKLTDRGCRGAPDLVVEIASPGSRRMDDIYKNRLYGDAGVREYWVVDPAVRKSIIYHYEEDSAPEPVPFDRPITSGILAGLRVVIGDFLTE